MSGGPLMIPIIACSLFALAIIIERAIFFLSIRFDKEQILYGILEKVRKNRIPEAIEICERSPFHMTNILKAGLLHHEEPKEIIKEAMEDASLYEVPKLEKNLHFLSTLSHVVPLFGLLGTAIGFIECFKVIDSRSLVVGVVSVSDLAGGVWVALISTAASLCVAIPGYIAYHYFVYKVNISVLEAERAATELMQALSKMRYSGEA